MFKQPALISFFVPRLPAKTVFVRAFAAVILMALSASVLAQSAGQFQFTAKTYRATEKQGSALITVTRVNGAQGKVSVDVMTSDGTATNGVDYAGLTNTLIFNDYQMAAGFLVPIKANPNTNAAPLTVKLSLANPKPAPGEDPSLVPSLGSITNAVINILDMNARFNFEQTVYTTTAEGGNVQVFVTLAEGAGQGFTVDYSIPNPFPLPLQAGSDAAIQDVDYTAVSGTLDFSNGNRQSITIPILADSQVEFNEDLQVTLSNAQGSYADPADTNMPPKMISLKVGQASTTTVTILYTGSGTNHPAGAVDLTFNPDNNPTTTPAFNKTPGANNTVYSLALQRDGKVLLGGDFSAVDATSRGHVGRVETNGLNDATFDPGTGANDFVNSVAPYLKGRQRGKILIGGGFKSINGQQRNSVARLLENGALDTTFDPGTGANGPVYSVVPAVLGGAIVAGDFTVFNGIPRNRIALLKSDGSVDQTFATNSAADAKINTIGASYVPTVPFTFSRNGSDTNKLVRFLDAGGNGGTIFLNYNLYTDDDILSVFQGTNQLFTTGLTNTFTVITNADSTTTTNTFFAQKIIDFGPGTGLSDTLIRFEVNVGQTNDTARFDFNGTIESDAVSRLVVGGEFNFYNGLARSKVADLDPITGNAKTNFNIGTGADRAVNAILIEPDGRLILGGSFTTFNSVPRSSLARLLFGATPGALDPSFHPMANDIVLSLAFQSTNEVYVGGNFTAVDGTRRMGLARLFEDGSIDTSFLDSAYNQFAGIATPDGFAPIGFISSIAIQTNGDVLIGGSFTRLGGGTSRTDIHPRYNYARLIGGATPGPGNVEFPSDTLGVDENAGSLSASVLRLNGNLGPVSVTGSTQDKVAIAGQDYQAATNVITFPLSGSAATSGSTNTLSFNVNIINDAIPDGDKPFGIKLQNPSGVLLLGGEAIPNNVALGNHSSADAIIIGNVFAVGQFAFSQPEFLVNKNGGDAVITVVRTNGTTGKVLIGYATTTNGTALAGSDYDPASGKLVFESGQSSNSFTIHVHDNTTIEPDKSVILKLSLPSSGTLGSLSNAVLTIIDDDLPSGHVSFVQTNYTVIENAGTAKIAVRRLGGSAGVLTVDYATADGTASSPTRYVPTTGTLVWNDGDISVKTFEVPIVNDGLVEPNQTVLLSLLNPSVTGGLGTRTNATLTIVDDDAFGSLGFGAPLYIADKNGGPATIIVTRRDGSAQSVSVNYSTTTNGTGRAGVDYTPVNGTLSFGVGELSKTIIVPVLDNSIPSGVRTVTLVLSNAVNGTLSAQTNTTLQIVDNKAVNIPAGSIDTDFDPGTGPNNAVYTLALQDDGRILLGGDFTSFNQQARGRVTRILNSGSLDPAFIPTASVNGAVRNVLLERDGRIVLGGAFTNVNGITLKNIARLTPGGTLDGTFDPGAGADNPVYALAETLSDFQSKILVGGSFSTIGGVSRNNIARLNSNATVDLSFNPGSGANTTVYAIAVLRNGKIMIGGDFTAFNGVNRPNIARLNADGSLDASFDPGSGADGSVRTIAIQNDDKIIIGGLFTQISGVSRPHVARLNPDGTLDANFNPGTGANGPVYAAAVQVDGKIVLGGDFTTFNGVQRNRITRSNPDGSVDDTINFGTGADGFISSVVIQGDRKILIAGGFTSFDGFPRNYLARINGGSIAGAGSVEFDSADFVVSQSETNAVVTLRRTGGTTGRISADFATSAGTAAPLTDYIETTGTVFFDPGQTIQTINIPIIHDTVPEPDETVNLTLSNPGAGATLGRQPIATLTIVSDVSVLSFAEPAYIVNENVAGGKAVIKVTRTGATNRLVTVRYSTEDSTAISGVNYTNSTGVLTFAPGQTVQSFGVPLVNDNIVEGDKVVLLHLTSPTGGGVLGQANATLSIVDDDVAPGVISFDGPVSVNENAGSATITVSRSSGHTGIVSVDYVTVPGTALEGVDYIKTQGTLTFVDGETSKSFIVPVKDDGLVDGNETVLLQLSNPTGGASLGALTNVTLTIVDIHFGPGSLDQSFDAAVGGTVRSIAMQPDGKIVLGGTFTSVGGAFAQNVGRINADSSFDNSFANGSAPSGTVDSVSLEPNGKIAIGGAFRSVGTSSRGWASVLLTNGVVDPILTLTASENAEVLAVAAQPDGKVVIGGSFTSPQNGIARFNSNGSLDVSFNSDNGTDLPVRTVALQPDGRVLIGGNFTRVGSVPRGSFARLQTTGLLDISFATGTGANGVVNAILPLPNGKILIGGNFTLVNGAARARVARLNSDGSIDNSFVAGTGPNGAVSALAVQSDGKIFIGGSFTSVNGTNRARIARLNSDGSLDAGFDTGRGPDSTVLAILPDPATGKVVIAGLFSSVTGFSRPGLARLNGDPIVPPTSIQITSVTRIAGGQIRIDFGSQTGRSYAVETSSDLKTWTQASTLTATGPNSEFTDSNTTGSKQRFYRVRSL